MTPDRKSSKLESRVNLSVNSLLVAIPSANKILTAYLRIQKRHLIFFLNDRSILMIIYSAEADNFSIALVNAGQLYIV